MIAFTGSEGNRIVGEAAGDLEGPLVLFLHGGGQTRHAWRGAQQALARRGLGSIALDARGHGDSEWTSRAGYSLEAFADDLEAVIRSLGRPVAVVGASLGGLTALLALAKYPGLACNALVLVDVVPRPNGAGVANIKRFMSANRGGFETPDAAADAVASYIPGRARPASAEGLRKNLRQASDGRYYWHWDPAFLDHVGSVQDFAAVMEGAVRQGLVRMLLVRGVGSDVVTDDEVADFRQLAPDVPVMDIGDAGHMVVGDQNDVFVAAIVDFLARPAQP